MLLNRVSMGPELKHPLGHWIIIIIIIIIIAAAAVLDLWSLTYVFSQLEMKLEIMCPAPVSCATEKIK